MNGKKTLLVVEDNELNREMLTLLLEDTYQVLTAENGAAGLAVLEERGPEIALILLDIQMPVMDGYEFLSAVAARGRHADIPIIVTTSGDSDEEELRCLSLGASDFVVKPYKPEIVRKRVEGLIRLRETTRMLHKVERDESTGLYNREAFAFHLTQRLHAEPDTVCDMFCLEIESHMDLLSRYGEQKFAAALRRLAERLTEALPTALIGRVETEQLAVFTDHRPLEEHEALAAALSRESASGEIPSVKLNFGIYPQVDRGLNFAAILSNALRPINAIRYQYGRNVALYDGEIRRRQELERLVAESGEAGLAGQQFKVWYQPKHHAGRDATGGAEALVRWVHPVLGFISPGAFIPVFESNGFIIRVDLYVVDRVCADLRRWLDGGNPAVPVSTNISQIDFDMPDLADRLESIVDSYRIPHELVHFEITESANAGDKKKKADAVAQLHAKGFALELDDFGSGYSNLTTLGELPIDVIKLDMSLVRNMDEPGHLAILRGVLYTAALLGKRVVAEGVETEAQARTLMELCADRIDLYYQGYYYSKPLPREEFEAYLSREKGE